MPGLAALDPLHVTRCRAGSSIVTGVLPLGETIASAIGPGPVSSPAGVGSLPVQVPA